jgi:hypothetical protein
MDHLFLERNFFLLGRASIYLGDPNEDRDSPLQSGYQGKYKEAKVLASFFVDFGVWFI